MTAYAPTPRSDAALVRLLLRRFRKLSQLYTAREILGPLIQARLPVRYLDKITGVAATSIRRHVIEGRRISLVNARMLEKWSEKRISIEKMMSRDEIE